MNDERRIDRMAGCSCLGKGMLTAAAVVLAVFFLLNLNRCFYATDSDGWPSGRYLEVLSAAKDLQIAISIYEGEYQKFPIAAANKTDDIHLRSRGQLVTEIVLLEGAKLNLKQIKFIEPRLAKNRKNGLWQDDADWVISDAWGEPYHIILDTNEDNMITNPEFGADQSDPKYAKKCRLTPPSPTLPSEVLVYSSGPDRDPKTWHDNICSWRN